MNNALEVRLAKAEDLAALPGVDSAADSVFETIGIWPLPPAATAEQLAKAAAILVAGDPPVGFARIDVIEHAAHLEQLSVHPDAMRRGIGSSLLRAAIDWARGHGYDAMTLATFRDVAWNAPFYARNGFAVVAPDTPALQVVDEHERRLGMPDLGARVLMRIRL